MCLAGTSVRVAPAAWPTTPRRRGLPTARDRDLKEGVPERSFDGDGRVELEYHDDAGDYRGWVMVEQAETGRFVRWAITCEDDVGEQ